MQETEVKNDVIIRIMPTFAFILRLLLHSMLLTAYSCLVYGDAAKAGRANTYLFQIDQEIYKIMYWKV